MNTPPLLMFVVENGDYPWLHSEMEAGRLPFLAKLRGEGRHITLNGPEFVTEHGLGLTTMSGRSRAEHGWYYFRTLLPGTYRLESQNIDRLDKFPPFWHALAGSDRAVVSIDAPESGIVPEVRGAQVALWSSHEAYLSSFPPQLEPELLLSDVEATLGPRHRIPEHLNHPSEREDLEVFAMLKARIAAKQNLFAKLIERERPAVAVLGLGETHTAMHRFWRYKGTSSPLATATSELHHLHDSLMRSVHGQYDDAPNVAVVVMYGSREMYPVTGLSRAIMRASGLEVERPSAKSGIGPREIARRLLPLSVREKIGAMLPKNAQESLLANELEGALDWSRTKAFSIPSLYSSFIRINLAGREPQGVVTEADYRGVVEEIRRAFLAVRIPGTDDCPIESVRASIDLFGSIPDSLPDVFVEWKSAKAFLPAVTLNGVRCTQNPPSYYRETCHHFEGHLFMAGPSIEPSSVAESADLLQIAPTMLSLIDAPIPPSMKGHPIELLSHAGVAP